MRVLMTLVESPWLGARLRTCRTEKSGGGGGEKGRRGCGVSAKGGEGEVSHERSRVVMKE
jgi:hypothetical protein